MSVPSTREPQKIPVNQVPRVRFHPRVSASLHILNLFWTFTL
jgi:hypothetical protein